MSCAVLAFGIPLTNAMFRVVTEALDGARAASVVHSDEQEDGDDASAIVSRAPPWLAALLGLEDAPMALVPMSDDWDDGLLIGPTALVLTASVRASAVGQLLDLGRVLGQHDSGIRAQDFVLPPALRAVATPRECQPR
jgi:hypothetical protein